MLNFAFVGEVLNVANALATTVNKMDVIDCMNSEVFVLSRVTYSQGKSLKREKAIQELKKVKIMPCSYIVCFKYM